MPRWCANHQGNKQPIEPSLVNQTTSKADDYTTRQQIWACGVVGSAFP